jgi:hypothetical protein
MEPAPIQYDFRRDAAGWTVFDRWTGQIVVLGGFQQCGLPLLAAQDLVDRLNSRRSLGERDVLQ